MAGTAITAAIAAITAISRDTASIVRARHSSQSYQLSTLLLRLSLTQAPRSLYFSPSFCSPLPTLLSLL